MPGGVGKHLRKAKQCRDGLGVPQEGREDWRPSRRAGGSGVPSVVLGVVGGLLEGCQGSEGFSGGPEGSSGYGKPCRRAGIGQEALPYGCESTGGVGSSPGGPG